LPVSETLIDEKRTDARGIGGARRRYEFDPQRDVLPLTFVVFVLILAFLRPEFVSPDNIASILRSASIIGIIACGMTLVMIGGGFDLSVARVAALAGVVAGTLQPRGIVVAVVGTLAICALIGLVNGVLITRARVNPFVVTLGMFSIAQSLTLLVSDGQTVRGFSDEFLAIGTGDFGPVPRVVVYFVVVAAGTHFLLSRTVYGRHLYATGDNAEAARLAGVRTDAVIASTYVLVSVLAGVAGIVMTSRLRTATPGALEGGELAAIAAVIIGGTRLGGGVGTIPRTVLGVLILAMLGNALVLLGVAPFWQGLMTGGVIILAVALDALYRGRR
jgi:ribose/xylose/arabinose/galactoside ABC-type transport system permease subunit